MQYDKQLYDLGQRLAYIQDIFAGKHADDINLLSSHLDEVRKGLERNTLHDSAVSVKTLEDLFVFMERKLEDRLTPMDRVRIVRHPQRICLRDILENVYDNYTEIGGQDEHTNDPAMLIARATITRRRGKKTFSQSVLVVGHEKGHGEEFRNGGSAKPWGNAKAATFMQVADTEGIPIHAYIFTPGGDPLEDYPGAAQQIAKNIYSMVGLEVPVVAIFSEGGSGGAEAIAFADKRLMMSHGYYSVISPEGAAAIEGRIRRGERASAELVEQCATNLHLTAQDNLEFGYIDQVLQEPVLGARSNNFDFFRTLRQEVLRATDEVVLSTRAYLPFRRRVSKRLRSSKSKLDETHIRWELTRTERKRLVEIRYGRFRIASRKSFLNRRSWLGKFTDAWSEQLWEIYNRLFYDIYHRNRRTFSNVLEEVNAELEGFGKRIGKPFIRLKNAFAEKNNTQQMSEELTSLSEWDRTGERGDWAWVSSKAKADRSIACPNASTHGCMDLWAPDLYNEFAGVCTTCGHHFGMEYQWMLYNCFDENSIFEFNAEIESGNPLNYPGFDQKLEQARENTGLKSACLSFEGRVDGIQMVVAVLAGSFRGGSVGAAEGAKFMAAAERARSKRYPFVVYCHGTAGIRIQEGTHGLIQMPRCTMAVQRYIEAGGLYIVLYDTNSYGGPVASFLGCASYQFAIRSSNIGFAGPGVIKNTTGRDVPPNYHNCFQALSRGHIQGVWDRRDVRNNLKQALLTMGGGNLYYK